MNETATRTRWSMRHMPEDVESTAMRMVSMYKHSAYTPYERATDHAFSYDSHEAGRKFWIEVLQVMYRLENQHEQDTEKT